jgi:hypothetical protein
MNTKDIATQSDELQARMREQLGQLGQEEIDLTARYSKAVVLVTGIIDELKESVIANKLLKEHIISLAETYKSSGDSLEESPLTWTGSKADLIELIYGLETVGVINKGGADIKEIARRFESLFNISLGNFYRQFLDIRLRKKEKTTFLNQMKEKLEVRMDDFK